MALYLKGIGDIATRVNEIIPSFDALIYNFIVGYPSGVIKGDFYEFNATIIDRGVRVQSGAMQAYGYFGMSDADEVINFVMPSLTSYVHIYAEIDLSVVPNKFAIKTSAMSNSSAYTYRQDNLKTARSGKFQLPLWMATLTASTIILTDRRAYISKIKEAESSDIAVTQPQTDNSNRVATTSYVRQAVSDAFNITVADIKTSAGTYIGRIFRQGNFVYCYGDAYNKGDAVIPEGFRPKVNTTVGVSGVWQALSLYPNNQVSGGATGYIQPDGTIRVTLQGYISQYLAVLYTAASFYGGWHIT